MIADQGGLEAATEKYGPEAERLSKWAATMAVAKVTGKASRVAAFIVMWAAAMREEGADEFSITEYQRYWNESERRAYRLRWSSASSGLSSRRRTSLRGRLCGISTGS